MAGRNPKLTQNVINRIVQARKIGATYEIAALYAGISRSILSLWLKTAREIREGRIPESPTYRQKRKTLLELLTQVEEADAMAAMSWLGVVEKSAKTDPAWAWKMLQHRYPEYVPVQRQEVSGPNGSPVAVDIESIRAKRWQQVAGALSNLPEEDNDAAHGDAG